MAKRPPLVYVVWEDAVRVDGDDTAWVDNAAVPYKAHLVHQCGFIVKDTDEGIQLTSAWNEHQIAPRDQIPHGMIRELTVLVEGDA